MAWSSKHCRKGSHWPWTLRYDIRLGVQYEEISKRKTKRCSVDSSMRHYGWNITLTRDAILDCFVSFCRWRPAAARHSCQPKLSCPNTTFNTSTEAICTFAFGHRCKACSSLSPNILQRRCDLKNIIECIANRLNEFARFFSQSRNYLVPLQPDAVAPCWRGESWGFSEPIVGCCAPSNLSKLTLSHPGRDTEPPDDETSHQFV